MPVAAAETVAALSKWIVSLIWQYTSSHCRQPRFHPPAHLTFISEGSHPNSYPRELPSLPVMNHHHLTIIVLYTLPPLQSGISQQYCILQYIILKQNTDWTLQLLISRGFLLKYTYYHVRLLIKLDYTYGHGSLKRGIYMKEQNE